VRERIGALLDAGSFHEIGSITGNGTYDEAGTLQSMTPTNFLFGRGRIEGRRVVVAGDDFTVRGGASDASIIEKQVAAEQMAHELRLPLIRLIEGSGGGGSIKSLEALGYTYVPFLPGFEHMVRNLATVPVVSLGLGPIAGFGAAKVVQSHYSLLVRGQSQMFVAGPPVVAAAFMRPTVQSTTTWRANRKRSNGRGATSATCPPPCTNFRLASRPATIPGVARNSSSRPSRATAARSIACARLSRPSSTPTRSSRSAACKAELDAAEDRAALAAEITQQRRYALPGRWHSPIARESCVSLRQPVDFAARACSSC
jgi:hypothetical protein